MNLQNNCIETEEWAMDFKHSTATSFFLPHQNLAESHHLSSGTKYSKPL